MNAKRVSEHIIRWMTDYSNQSG
ncbi:MAG: hypothetical protein RL226_123, partial [Bacteroidota bacterium]